MMTDYMHAKKVFRTFKNIGDDHDLYGQSDTLLLADIFENFRNKCIKYINFIQLIFYQHLD